MRYHRSAVVLIGLLVASAPAVPPKETPAAAKAELKALEGKWRVVKFLHADRETNPGTGEDEVTVEFKGDTIDFAGAAAGVVAELDPATDPKCFDFEVAAGSGVFQAGTTYESVYRRDGDTLTWAVYTGRGKSRPATLDKPADAGVMVMVLNRVKR